MRKLVLLVCIGATAIALNHLPAQAGVIPTLEDPSGRIGFYPITNEFSLSRNFDAAGESRGTTFQIISINSFRLLTEFSFEFTGDFNWDLAPGVDRDHYVELSLVKPLVPHLSVNVQRIISSFEDKPINQFGFRLSL